LHYVDREAKTVITHLSCTTRKFPFKTNVTNSVCLSPLKIWTVNPTSPQKIYILSRKTMNTRENLWNVYCFATNQKRDETAEDNRQTAACISHALIRNNKLAFSSNELAFLSDALSSLV